MACNKGFAAGTQKMASAAEQKALSNPSQLNPEGPFEDSEDRARGPAKAKPYRFGFLKVEALSSPDILFQLDIPSNFHDPKGRNDIGHRSIQVFEN